MDNIYPKINQVASVQVYRFMKENKMSSLNYHFDDFFEACLDKYDIKLMEHHFSNQQIEGLTLIDEQGISFSYERDNPKVKQNFTKCHELGHFLLDHSGRFFTELKDKNDSQPEKEANIFSAIILMPSIVLLSKIFYRHDSFKKVIEDVAVSADALKYRLIDLFRYHINVDYDSIVDAVARYQEGDFKNILYLFNIIKDNIIAEYKSVKVDINQMILKKVASTGFVTSNEYEELLNWDYCKQLKSEANHIDTWIEYNRGNSLGFAWNTQEFSREEAIWKAKYILLLNY